MVVSSANSHTFSANEKADAKKNMAASFALQQEMNLARRACWSSEADSLATDHIQRKSCENSCEAYTKKHKNNDISETNYNNSSITTTTTNFTKKGYKSAVTAIDDPITNANSNAAADADAVTTSVLNGAKLSKFIANKISNNSNSYIHDCIENASECVSNCKNPNNNQPSNPLSSSSSNGGSATTADQLLAAANGCNANVPCDTNNAIVKRKNLSKNSLADAAAATVDDNSPATPLKNNTPTTNCNANLSATTAHWWQALLRYCLAFVAFCDVVTIKPNDPRYADAEQHKQQSGQQQQSKTQNSHTEANASSRQQNPQSTTKSTSKYKIITSKKFILLIVVCVFFGCVNRIDARPNASTAPASNVIDGETPLSSIRSADSAAQATTSSLPSSMQPDQPVITKSELPIGMKLKDMHGNEMRAGEDEGEHHHVERYPLSQVDFARVKTPFIIGVWILSASIAKIGFHMTPKLHLIFPESCLLIVVGVVIGVVLYFSTDVAVSPLTPNTFFFYMLPPIILDAGYFMPNRLFFDNLGTILLMAVVGTIFNIATIGGSLYACGLSGMFGDEAPKLLDTFLFSSLISAVDPVAVLAVFEEIHVNEILYIVVFGESLLNDAVTVVMYHMMEVYNEIGMQNIIVQDLASGVGSFFVVALGGTVIGIIWGFLTGLVTRFTDHVRVIEPIFIFVMAYLAYLNAEIFHMSGILAITFCGITMKNYVESNISQKSHTTVKYALKMLSSSSETIIFMFLGVATVNNNHVWNTWFVVLTIVFCSIYRVLGVILLTAMANRFRLHKLSRVDQFVMSYGGLRGAVAFALVLLVDESVVKHKEMFVTTTIAVIYFTVFVQGITIKPLVEILNVKRANKRKPTMNERIHERFMDHMMAGIEDIVGKTGNYNVRDKFKRFDNRFIRPLLIRDLKGAEPKIIETYSKLTMRDAMEVMRRNPSTIGQITGTESMSALFRNYTNNCIGGSPSLTNLDNTCSRNLDMHELDYNPSKKDLTDAKIHHLLAEELKPYRRHRRLSYSRHAVDDRDLSTQVNYKMQMNFRRMFNDRKHHKRSKRGGNKQQQDAAGGAAAGGVKQNHVSFHDFQQNGSTKQFTHEENQPKLTEVTVVSNDDWDDGLTFTAKSSLAEHPIPEEDRNISRDSDGERRVATPTATESQLPWKRQGDEISDAVQQNEFPAWASNKEYLAYNSPSATFLGGINKPKQPKSVIGLFRRESSGSKGGSSIGGGETIDSVSARGSDPALAAALSSMVVPSTYNPRLEKRSQSISSGSAINEGHAGPFPVTASHRRNVRRGSMLELSGEPIPEESYHHGHSKSLCEPQGAEWDTSQFASGAEAGSATSEKLLRSGREPLLPKLTPRAHIKRMGSAGGSKCQVTTALLSTSNSDYDDDEDEDFDLYDDENIVVTTTHVPKLAPTTGMSAASTSGQRSESGDSSSGNSSSTTTIRMTRNNDESII